MYSIELWNVTKRANSTKQGGGSGAGETVYLKREPTKSIIEPVFRLDGENINGLYNKNVLKWTYATGHSGWYWIKDIRSIANRVVEIECKRDPLATFKTAIGNYEGVVKRCTNGALYNKYDIDNVFTPNNYIKGQFEYSKTSGFSWINDSFTLCYYGKNGAYAVNTGQYITLMNNLFADNSLWGAVNQVLFNPSQYIASLIRLPLTFESYENDVSIKLGNADPFTLPVAYPIDYSTNYSLSKTITFTSTEISQNIKQSCAYLDDYRLIDDRITKVSLQLPFVGNVAISSSVLSQTGSINVKYTVDMVTGQGECYVYFDPDDIGQSVVDKKPTVLHKSNINVGAQIPLGVSDSGWMGVLNNLASNLGVPSPIAGLNFRDNITMIGSCNSAGYEDIGNVYLRVQQFMCDDIDNYRDVKGYPTNKKMQIKNVYPSSYSGSEPYIEMLNPSLEIEGATFDEINEINRYLEGGFYYE